MMFGIFRKKPTNAMEEFIFSVYGNPPPPKRANLDTAVDIAHEQLLAGQVSKSELMAVGAELSSGPIPYSTHDLAISIALSFFKNPVLIPRLKDAQLLARLTVSEWLSQRKVVPPLVKSFEDTLYELYKPGH